MAVGKVYTNSDLEHPPSLEKTSRIDPVTGKVIKDAYGSARKPARAEGWRGTVARIEEQAKHKAGWVMNEIETNKVAFAVTVGFLFLLWLACLLDILRNEFRGNNKLIWFIAVTFIPVVGCILYFFIGIRQRKYRFIRDYE